MADLQDVQDALAGLIAGGIYPNGASQPSVTGGAVRIYAGWPTAAKLDADLRNSVAHVTVYSQDGERNTNRYLEPWGELSRGAKTIGATISGVALTLTGTVATPQVVTALVNGKGYSYPVQDGDTLTSIAAALATLINADTTATSLGPVVTVPGAYRISCRIGVGGVIARVVRRQEKHFQIDIWARDNTVRGTLAKVIDPLLSGRNYIDLSDGTKGRIVYVKSMNIDETQPELLYRRVITYAVDYPTIEVDTAQEITITGLTIEADDGSDGLYPIQHVVTTLAQG